LRNNARVWLNSAKRGVVGSSLHRFHSLCPGDRACRTGCGFSGPLAPPHRWVRAECEECARDSGARGRSGACVNSSAVREGSAGGEEEKEDSDYDLSLDEKLHYRNSFCFPGKCTSRTDC